MTARHWQRPSWLALALALAGIALFVRLGVWQYGRMLEKQATLDAVATVIAERKPVSLLQAADVARAGAYDWAAGNGAFTDTAPLLLDNQIRNGHPGIRVYRVFYPDDASFHASPDNALLIDLGWVPLQGDRTLPKLPSPGANHIAVRGLLAPPPSSGMSLGPGIEQRDDAWLLTRMDLAAIRRELGARTPALAPRVLRLDPALPIGYERDLDVLPNTLPPQRHLGYAVQWFAMALAALAIFVILHWRKVDNVKK
jgi:cytochrome oxidase assembly protein ShyY1